MKEVRNQLIEFSLITFFWCLWKVVYSVLNAGHAVFFDVFS